MGSRHRRSGRWGGWWSRLLALVLGFLVALVVFEVVARLFFPSARDHALPRKLVVTDDHLGWRLRKEVRVTHHTSHFEVVYATNALGHRDRARGIEKDHRRVRILLYGDSQVFGWGIPAAERFSNLVEKRIDSLEVWNLAVPGYGLDQQILSYQRYGEGYGADAVVFYLSEATLHRMSFDYIFGIHKPRFGVDSHGRLQVEAPKSTPGRSLLFVMPDWAYLPYFLDRRLGALDDRLRRGRAKSGDSEARQKILEESLAFAARIAHSRQQRTIVLSQLPAARRPWVRNLGPGLDVRYLDIDLPEDREPLVLGRDDPHWNVACHRLVAAQLVSQVSPMLRLRTARSAAPSQRSSASLP